MDIHGSLFQERVGSPDVVEQLFFGDEASPLFDEVEQDIEDLWLDITVTIGSSDLDAVGVDRVLPETETWH